VLFLCLHITHKHTEQVSAAVTFCTCVRKVSGFDFFRSSSCFNKFVGGFSAAPDECRDYIVVRIRPLPFASPSFSLVICREALTALWNEPPPPHVLNATIWICTDCLGRLLAFFSLVGMEVSGTKSCHVTFAATYSHIFQNLPFAIISWLEALYMNCSWKLQKYFDANIYSAHMWR